jgi:hypothetical protein
MKNRCLIVSILTVFVILSGCSTPGNNETVSLSLKEAEQKGSFELVENTAGGAVAIQRGPEESTFIWKDPGAIEPGWYRINFIASSNFQVIADRLEELEPFVFSVITPEKEQKKGQRSFSYKENDSEEMDLNDLPTPLLKPTTVKTWHSSRPLWIDSTSQIEMAVRRPLLVVGDIELQKLSEKELTHLTLEGQGFYNMFTDGEQVVFNYELENFGKSFRGELRFVLKDALDGTEEIKTVPVKIDEKGLVKGTVEWTPKFGAYRLAGEIVNSEGDLLYREFRHLTYGPEVDTKDLPVDWPVAFHRHPSHPEQVPPIGAKWIRLWGGWERMEPQPGEYDWSMMDVNVQMAKKYGHKLLWACHGVPEWSLPEEDRDKRRAFANYAPEDIDRVRPFLRDFWERYADEGVIGAIEIGNEPNAHPGWPPEKYGQMARAIYEETHKATDDVKVVGISMSGGTHMDYMEKALNAGLDKYMDIASLHLYEIGNPVGNRSIARKTNQFMKKLEEHGLDDMPVWNTESGSGTDIRQDGVMLSQEELNRQIMQHPDFDPEMAWRIGNAWRGSAELRGTGLMIRASYQQFAMGVRKNFMFQWSGSSHHYWIHDWREGGNPMPKIKVVATAVMSKMLLDYGPNATPDQPEVEAQDEWLAFAHRYEGPKGRMTVVYVHPDVYTGSGDQVAALAAGDDDVKTDADIKSPWLRTKEPEPVKVRVPVSKQQVKVVDMFARNSQTLTATDGFVEIDAFEVPQYIIE